MADQEKAKQFESWLAQMSVALAEFIEFLPQEVRGRLDGTPASLEVLERWLLDRYPHVSNTRPGSEAKTLDGAARYFGEVFRAASQSRWALQQGDPKTLFYGMPILIGGKLNAVPLCPLTSITASLDRRTGKYLLGLVKNFSD